MKLGLLANRFSALTRKEKVRGQAVFAADFHLSNELVGEFIPSPYAHAEILSIDTSHAEALPGVYAVITSEDIPDVPATTPAQDLEREEKENRDYRDHDYRKRAKNAAVERKVAQPLYKKPQRVPVMESVRGCFEENQRLSSIRSVW